MSAKKIYKFKWSCGRMGSLSSVFVATQAEVDEVMGKEVYFGEVLGKHSEIYGTIKPGEIVEIPSTLEIVEFFEKHLGGSFGHNPLEYYADRQYEEAGSRS